jgi:N-acetylglucosaminyl-diphospho-decaprenol L-rhamnosyltransferase
VSGIPAGSMKPVSLGIIVVSYRVCDLLRACLAATYAGLARSPWLEARVIVVDNASGDGSAEMVAAEFPAAKLIASERNLGFAGGNNLALRALGFGPEGSPQLEPSGLTASAARPRAGRPDFVLLLNPDTEPQADAIGYMVSFLQQNPRAGGAGARLEYPDGRFQHGAFAFPGLLQLCFDLFPPRPRRLLETRLNGRYRRSIYDAGIPFPVDFPLGAALMVRREAIDAAGLLDEGYFMYAEEVDWCWRIRKTGWRFSCVPAARVIHHGGASTGQFRGHSFVNLWRSRQRLYRRFYGPLRRWAASRLVRIGMAAERARARRAAARGETDRAEMTDRLRAIGEVVEMFR